METVGVVIPVRNRPVEVIRAVRSCLGQTRAVAQVTVVDDASDDDTPARLFDLTKEDPRVRMIRLNQNAGPQAARIRGCEETPTDWIALLDSDDELVADSIENRLEAAAGRNDAPALVYGDLYMEHQRKDREIRFWKLAGHVYPEICRELGLCPPSVVIFRRDSLELLRTLDLSLPAWEGQDFVLTIARRRAIFHCGRAVAVRHASAAQLSRENRRMVEGCRKMLKKYGADVRKHHGFLCRLLWQIRYLTLVWAEYRFGAALNRPIRKLLSLYFYFIPERLFKGIPMR